MILYKKKKTVITAYQIEKGTMGGYPKSLPNVYLEKRCAEIFCEDNEEDFVSYKVNTVNVEKIDEKRGIVLNTDDIEHHQVVSIISTTSKQMIKDRALKKLTNEEILALGIK